MKTLKWLRNVIGLALLLGMIVINGGSFSASAQESNEWFPPRNIPGLSDDVLSPYLVADQNGTVHAFVSDWVRENENDSAIFYTRWTRDQGWSVPVDIVLSPHHHARVKGVTLDPDGTFHLVFFGGEDNNAEIYYSQAAAVHADKTQAWSEPVIVGERAITPDEAAIAGDVSGNLHIVFGARKDGNSLYSVHSSDGGKTWSDPLPIFLTLSNILWPSHLQIFVDSDSTLHAVWSVGDLSGNGLAVYYANLVVGASSWTEPIVLAESTGFEADTPSIIEYKDELFVIYHNDSPTTRWMRRSSDGGETWSEPVRLFQHVGSNGAAALVIDGKNDMHMFFGNRVGSHPAAHGMWHSEWKDGRWSTPEAIVSGLVGPGFDPAQAKAAVSQGNLILVSWIQELGQINKGTANGAWYSTLSIDSEEIPIVPLPTTNSITQSSHLEKDSVVPTKAPVPVLPDLELPESIQTPDSASMPSPMRQILIGIIPVVALIFAFMIILRRGHR